MNQLAFPVQPYNSHVTYGSPHDPTPIGNGTYTSWPGGVDPSVPLYAGNPVPLSMGSTMSRNRRQSGGRRCWGRKNRKGSRKNTRKNSRKNRKNRKNSRKNRKGSRKGSRRA
jgi:hypothetical protein